MWMVFFGDAFQLKLSGVRFLVSRRGNAKNWKSMKHSSFLQMGRIYINSPFVVVFYLLFDSELHCFMTVGLEVWSKSRTRLFFFSRELYRKSFVARPFLHSSAGSRFVIIGRSAQTPHPTFFF